MYVTAMYWLYIVVVKIIYLLYGEGRPHEAMNAWPQQPQKAEKAMEKSKLYRNSNQ